MHKSRGCRHPVLRVWANSNEHADVMTCEVDEVEIVRVKQLQMWFKVQVRVEILNHRGSIFLLDKF